MFAILTDSGADVPKEYIEKYPVYVAPLHIVYKNESFLDGVDISPEEVTARFAQEIPSTSLPSVDEVAQKIKKIKEDGYSQVLCIPISSGLSGTLNSMRIASELFPEMEFSFVDTKNIGIGSGMLVTLAANLLEEGKILQQAQAIVNDHVDKTKLFFCVPSLDYLRKGGRIGLVASYVGIALGLRPVITCNEDGIYTTINKARGWKKAIKTALREAVDFVSGHPDYNIAIAHVSCEEEAKSIQEKLADLLPNPKKIYFGSISPALTVHTGPGLIGIGVQKIQTV